MTLRGVFARLKNDAVSYELPITNTSRQDQRLTIQQVYYTDDPGYGRRVYSFPAGAEWAVVLPDHTVTFEIKIGDEIEVMVGCHIDEVQITERMIYETSLMVITPLDE